MRAVMFERFDQTAELLAVMLAPVAARLRRIDVKASLIMATEVMALMTWLAAVRHRDRVKTGEFQRELSDMIARYLLTDPERSK
jgi:hypothetical protein